MMDNAQIEEFIKSLCVKMIAHVNCSYTIQRGITESYGDSGIAKFVPTDGYTVTVHINGGATGPFVEDVERPMSVKIKPDGK